MDYDTDKVDEMVLALLCLTMFPEAGGTRAWKGHAWEALDRLHAKGSISDPKSKAKSVWMSDEGVQRARESCSSGTSRERSESSHDSLLKQRQETIPIKEVMGGHYVEAVEFCRETLGAEQELRTD